MILVTGGAGFIGSHIVRALNVQRPNEPIVIVDYFGTGDKWKNIAKLNIAQIVAPDDIFEFLNGTTEVTRAVIHMGAISSTVERDVDMLIETNIRLSIGLWTWCCERNVPFIYASSASVYGSGKEFEESSELSPLNAYGWSKSVVDKIFEKAKVTPPQWVGLRFFNVYGINEVHKDKQQSVISKWYRDLLDGRPIRMFRHGEQKRDFVYVRDCVNAVMQALAFPSVSGIFNIGTGAARSFSDVAKILYKITGAIEQIDFFSMPIELHNQYQSFTQADISKAISTGLIIKPTSLEDGIKDFIKKSS